MVSQITPGSCDPGHNLDPQTSHNLKEPHWLQKNKIKKPISLITFNKHILMQTDQFLNLLGSYLICKALI